MRAQGEDRHPHAQERGPGEADPAHVFISGYWPPELCCTQSSKPFLPFVLEHTLIKLPSPRSRDFSRQGYQWPPPCAAVSNGHSPVFVLLDLSAASNTVDHTLHLKLENLLAFRTPHSLGFPLTMETHPLSLIAVSSSPTWPLTSEYPVLWPLLLSIYILFLRDHIESNGVKNTIYLLKIYMH